MSKEKTEKMRYLAIIQVKPNNTFEKVEILGGNESFVVGDWTINASLDVNQPAYIQMIKKDGSAGLVSSGQLILGKKIVKHINLFNNLLLSAAILFYLLT